MFNSLMKRDSTRQTIVVGIWGAALFGVLQVHRLPTLSEHSICSPMWGCGPPVNALISYHGFWLLLISAPTWLALRMLTIRQLTIAGCLLAIVGTTAMVGIVIWQAMVWLPTASEFQKPFFVQRCLFQLAVMIDFPAIQLLLSGVCCLLIARFRRRSSQELQSDGPPVSTGIHRQTPGFSPDSVN